MEKALGRNLEAFFSAWLQKRGVPHLMVRVRLPRSKNGDCRGSLEPQRVLKEVAVFSWPRPKDFLEYAFWTYFFPKELVIKLKHFYGE